MTDKLSNYNAQILYSCIMNNIHSNTFINDRDKMIDFWDLTKEEFLETYSYLTEEEYDNSVKEVCKKLKFNNYEEFDGDGKDLKRIALSVLLVEKLLFLFGQIKGE